VSRRAKGTGEALRDFPTFRPLSYVVFAFLYLPLLFVVGYSFNDNRIVTVWKGFTFHWYGDVLGNHDIQRALMNSLKVAVVATVVSVVLATGLAIGLLTLWRRGRAFAWGLIGAPLIIPEIVFAIGTLALFVQVKVPLGVGAIMLAHIAFCIPFALLPIRARLQGVDVSVYEAAADLGANEWTIFRRITLPLHRVVLPRRPRRNDPAGLHLQHDPQLDHAGNQRAVNDAPRAEHPHRHGLVSTNQEEEVAQWHEAGRRRGS
jgi:ABC-type spermidine/putrescine transport system permease subunit II